MTPIERDEYLTKKLGNCPHSNVIIEEPFPFDVEECADCGAVGDGLRLLSFNAWAGFGAIIEFLATNDLTVAFNVAATRHFGYEMDEAFAEDFGCNLPTEAMSPSVLADCAVKFFKGRDDAY